MKLPLRIAKALLRLSQAETLPASQVKHRVIDELVEAQILFRTGRVKQRVGLINLQHLELYLHNHFSIRDLSTYIAAMEQEGVSRAVLTGASGDSKLKKVRTFKGFLVNSFTTIPASLNGLDILIEPREGLFHFIYDFESFVPAKDVTIVGVENAENFRWLKEQAYLFKDIRPLFVSRYPQSQSKDLIKWLRAIPNDYLHFGDFDFSGIGIYINEFKKYIPSRSTFFIPDGLEEILRHSGSRRRYNVQRINFDLSAIDEEPILDLIALLHRYKKGLDQEGFILEQ